MLEKIPVQIVANPLEASLSVANEIAHLIRARQEEGKQYILGLATSVCKIGNAVLYASVQ